MADHWITCPIVAYIYLIFNVYALVVTARFINTFQMLVIQQVILII